MKTVKLFEYTCPECGLGTVRTTRILNYKTKIKGYPFVVEEALIGVRDRCQAESFAPEGTKRWEELLYRSLMHPRPLGLARIETCYTAVCADQVWWCLA